MDTFTLNGRRIGSTLKEAADYCRAHPEEWPRHDVKWDCGDVDPALTWIEVNSDVRDLIDSEDDA